MTESQWQQGHRVESSEAPFDELPATEQDRTFEPLGIRTVSDEVIGRVALSDQGKSEEN